MPKKIFFTPGPSALYFTVEEHLKQAMRDQVMEINHRSSQAEGYFRTAVDNLKSLMSIPEDYSIFFLSSATATLKVQDLVQKIASGNGVCFAHGKTHFLETVTVQNGSEMMLIGIDLRVSHHMQVPHSLTTTFV